MVYGLSDAKAYVKMYKNWNLASCLTKCTVVSLFENLSKSIMV